MNLIAGNAINLTSKNITITSNAFQVNKDGEVTCSDINITGGKIALKDTGDYASSESSVLEIKNQNGRSAEYGSWGMILDSNSSSAGYEAGNFYCGEGNYQFMYSSENGEQMLAMLNNNTGVHPIYISDNNSVFKNPNGNTSLHLQNNGAFVQGDGLFVNGYRVLTNTSDKELKENIKDSNVSAIEILKKIQHRQFNWKEDGKYQDIGYIAQELEQINPNYVHKDIKYDENGKEIGYYYQINVLNLLELATKGIQEQQDIIENLKERIEKLEAK